MKTEDREKEDAGLMGAWNHAQYAGETEREKHTEKTLFQKCTHSMFFFSTMCVFNAHFLYKSFGGLTEVLSYFNALKERLHKLQNIFLTEYLSLSHTISIT